MDDYISRQAAIDALEERLQANGYSNVALVSELNRSIGYLMRLPSADVQPERHGRWIEVDDAYNRISGRCSNCGWEAHLYEDDVVGMPYCPNCGARMDGDYHDG